MDRLSHVSLLRCLFFLCVFFGMMQPLAHAERQAVEREVPVLSIEGAIGPATADYVASGIASAAEAGAPMVMIRMDTPGGLDTSMREIIRAIVNAPIPVITYVSPSGARAASAGAFILTASHVAAMAPGTNVGAATPVQLGAPGPLSPPEKEEEGKQGTGKPAQPKPAGASDAKALNDAIAYIRSLAELRGRNADWAEAAVREAASISAQAALERNVIDIVARDDADLLKQLDGRAIKIGEGEVRLATGKLVLADVEPNWRTRLLAAITNPNIALILLMIGLYGLLFEFMNPGALYPGTIGAICLLLGLYALSALPVNYAGIALILLGLALMTGEAFSPSFGVLGIGGLISFAMGATIMFDTDIPEFRVALPVLAAVAVASLAATTLIARLALKSRHSPVVSGREEFAGATGKVLDWRDGVGHVHVHGERWNAAGPASLTTGQRVRVTGLEGLVLSVETIDPSQKEE